jgi:hypothetical protein
MLCFWGPGVLGVRAHHKHSALATEVVLFHVHERSKRRVLSWIRRTWLKLVWKNEITASDTRLLLLASLRLGFVVMSIRFLGDIRCHGCRLRRCLRRVAISKLRPHRPCHQLQTMKVPGVSGDQ